MGRRRWSTGSMIAAFDPVKPHSQRTSGRWVISRASTPAFRTAATACFLRAVSLTGSFYPSASTSTRATHPVSWTMAGYIAEEPLTEQQRGLSRRKFLIRAPLALAGAVALYSAEVSRHEISVETRRLAIRDLPAAFHGFRVAQISDIHFG